MRKSFSLPHFPPYPLSLTDVSKRPARPNLLTEVGKRENSLWRLFSEWLECCACLANITPVHRRKTLCICSWIWILSARPKMNACAGHACLSCAQKKRKCDRLFPSCSSCLKWAFLTHLGPTHVQADLTRQKRQCWYKVAASVPTWENKNDGRNLNASTKLIIPTDLRPESSLHPRNSAIQAAILPLTSDIVRPIGACLQCSARKRKCDKKWPTCGRCSRYHCW